MPVEIITSRQNSLLVHIRKLAASRSYRSEHREYLCDGLKMLEEAIKWKAAVNTVVFSEDCALPALPERARKVQVPKEVMRSISLMEAPQGVVFTVSLPQMRLPERLDGEHYLVLEGVQDPGNVGTILRTADAFSCDGIFLLAGCADVYNPKTVRATMGAVFRREVWTCSREELCALLQKSEMPLYGAALQHRSLRLGKADLSRCAVAIGSEGRGLSEELLSCCTETVRIPMDERCESLNAAVAASVILWDMYR